MAAAIQMAGPCRLLHRAWRALQRQEAAPPGANDAGATDGNRDTVSPADNVKSEGQS